MHVIDISSNTVYNFDCMITILYCKLQLCIYTYSMHAVPLLRDHMHLRGKMVSSSNLKRWSLKGEFSIHVWDILCAFVCSQYKAGRGLKIVYELCGLSRGWLKEVYSIK